MSKTANTNLRKAHDVFPYFFKFKIYVQTELYVLKELLYPPLAISGKLFLYSTALI